jgi:hypothetical protein
MMRVLGCDFWWGLGIFLFTMSRTALGPTQPPIQRVPQALSLGVKWPGHEADHSPPSSAVEECVELYLHSPNKPSWHGAQLKGSTGTTLPFTFTLITKNKLDEEQNGFQEGSSCSVGNLKLTQVL